MSFEEKGAYIELLVLQFNRGHMTSDMVGRTVGQLWGQLKDKFKVDSEGLFYNERLDIEMNKRKTFVDSRKNNLSGKNQYSKEEMELPLMDGHMTSHTEDVNINGDDNVIKEAWDKWKKYKKDEFGFKYKSEISEQAAKTELLNLCDSDADLAIKIIEQSIANGWKGLFKLNNNGTIKKGNGATTEQIAATVFKHFGKPAGPE